MTPAQHARTGIVRHFVPRLSVRIALGTALLWGAVLFRGTENLWITLGLSIVAGLITALLAQWLIGRELRGLGKGLRLLRDAVVADAPWPGAELKRAVTRAAASRDLKAVSVHLESLVDALTLDHAYRALVNSSGDVVFQLGADQRIVDVSANVVQILGAGAEDFVGRTVTSLAHTHDREALQELLAGECQSTERIRIRLADQRGGWRTLELVASLPEDSGLTGALITGRDITEQMRLQQELRQQAHHDNLTGLLNRLALKEGAEIAVTQARPASPVSILMIDLDGFKLVNDSLGHAYGDELLKEIALRLQKEMRPNDTVCRLGGDEFAVILPGTPTTAAVAVARRLRDTIDQSVELDGTPVRVGASIGIATSSGRESQEGPASAESLMRESDIAMYRAKERRLGVAVYDPNHDNQSSSRLEMAAELREGISRGEITLLYQPIVRLSNGQLDEVEALVRWQHPTRGLLPPSAFLDLAEESGLVVPMSEEVLRLAIRQAAAWWAQGRAIPVAVNVSTRLFQAVPVLELVSSALRDFNVPASMLRLEITEELLEEDGPLITGVLHALRALGVGLSLDDFGTGYSSMTGLRKLPVDRLKVDGEFIRSMTSVPQDAIVVATATELGHQLGMQVIAEGVEDEETLDQVRECGCELAQGYFFTAPLSAVDLWQWQDQHAPAASIG